MARGPRAATPCLSHASVLLALLLAVGPGALSAQAAMDPAPSGGGGLSILGGVATLGAVAALMFVDHGATQLITTHQNPTTDRLAGGFRRIGQPEVFLAATLGTWAVGLLSGNEALQGAGMRMTAAVGLAGLTTHGLKQVVGRARPNAGDPDDLQPLSSGRSLPSGHTTVAFALAASAADEIRSPVATVLLYGAATGTGISRMYERKHWLSDVALGAAIGIASAKFVNGKWTVFGLRAPQFLVTAGGIGVSAPLPN